MSASYRSYKKSKTEHHIHPEASTRTNEPLTADSNTMKPSENLTERNPYNEDLAGYADAGMGRAPKRLKENM